MKQWISYL